MNVLNCALHALTLVFLCVCFPLFVFVPLCVTICLYAYVHTCTHPCVRMSGLMHTCTCDSMPMPTCARLCMCVCPCVFFVGVSICARPCMRTCVDVCVCISVWMCCVHAYVCQMCNRWGVAGDHAGVLAQPAVREGIDQREQHDQRGLRQPVCHHLLCQLLHALCLSGEYREEVGGDCWVTWSHVSVVFYSCIINWKIKKNMSVRTALVEIHLFKILYMWAQAEEERKEIDPSLMHVLTGSSTPHSLQDWIQFSQV